MSNMSGSKPDEAVISSKSVKSPLLWIASIIGGVILLIAIIVMVFVFGRKSAPSTGPVREKEQSESTPRVRQERKLYPTPELPAPKPPRYGNVIINAKALATVPVGVNEHILYSPVDNVAYRVYVGNTQVRHYGINETPDEAAKKAPRDMNMSKDYIAGFILDEDRPNGDNRLGYYVCEGPPPPKEVWWALALSQPTQVPKE